MEKLDMAIVNISTPTCGGCHYKRRVKKGQQGCVLFPRDGKPTTLKRMDKKGKNGDKKAVRCAECLQYTVGQLLAAALLPKV